MSSPFRPKGTALITGAASGVGFATAKLCRQKFGMHLVMVDRDSGSLQKAVEALDDSNELLVVEAFDMDVGSTNAWAQVAQRVKESLGGVDFLMLNAGASHKAQGAQDDKLKVWKDLDYWTKTFNTNVHGYLNGLSAILPLMTSQSNKSPKSIVLTGSKQGITNPPGGANPAYNTSKAAVKYMAEHLSYDLRSDPATAHISVHLLIPGWTWTGLMGNVGPTNDREVKKADGAWFPSQVADYLVQAVERGSFYVLCSDNECDLALDQARMRWTSDDVIEDRPALSRWEASWKERAAAWIDEDAQRRRAGK